MDQRVSLPALRSLVFCGLMLALATHLAASELRQTPIVRAVQKARPSVVNIHSEKTLTTKDDRFGNFETSRRVNGMGTGVVIDERGYLITNHHVIDGVQKIRVTLHDGTSHQARLIAHDSDTDLAIIKIETTKKLPVVTIGTSRDLMPGEPVIAVGNAYGYEHTVTRGIISALHRTVQLNERQQYEDLIQTDASINPGNSGGPLLNIDGQMVGINVAVRAGAQGIGFAIPVDKALDVAAELMASLRKKKVWHGVVAASAAEHTPLKGLIVGHVDEDSPAARAGLQQGDVIVAVEDHRIDRLLDFERFLLDRKPGDEVAVEVKRDGKAIQLDMPLSSIAASGSAGLNEQAWQNLGMRFTPVPSTEFTQKRSRYRGGLLVKSVRNDGPAAGQGIRGGDVLVGLHIWETISLDNVAHILSRPELDQLTPLKFYVVRDGKTLYGYLPLDR